MAEEVSINTNSDTNEGTNLSGFLKTRQVYYSCSSAVGIEYVRTRYTYVCVSFFTTRQQYY